MPYLRGMKQKKQEPEYRSMNEVRLKYELIKHEKKILDITGDPTGYRHYCPFQIDNPDQQWHSKT